MHKANHSKKQVIVKWVKLQGIKAGRIQSDLIIIQGRKRTGITTVHPTDIYLVSYSHNKV